jgi:hypothetical protein
MSTDVERHLHGMRHRRRCRPMLRVSSDIGRHPPTSADDSATSAGHWRPGRKSLDARGFPSEKDFQNRPASSVRRMATFSEEHPSGQLRAGGPLNFGDIGRRRGEGRIWSVFCGNLPPDAL